MQVDTPRGPARVQLHHPSLSAGLLLVLGHGAGGGLRAPDLLAVRTAAVSAGAVVGLVEQPYRVAGRRAPAPAAQLDEAWTAVCADLTGRHPGLTLIAGGRSSGGRVACRTAPATGAAAVLALAFPLAPPSRRPHATPSSPTPGPSLIAGPIAAPAPAGPMVAPAPAGGAPRSRAGELVAAGVPVLVVNGDRDPFGVPADGGPVQVHVVAGADHSLRRHTLEVAAVVTAWLTERRWERPSPP